MDNYLLMGHILKCKVIPKSEYTPSYGLERTKSSRSAYAEGLPRVSQQGPFDL